MTNILRYISSRQFWEIFPLLFVLSILPFINDITHPISKILFFAFPFFYLPLLFSRKRILPAAFSKIVFCWSLFLASSFISLILSASVTLSLQIFFEYIGIFLYFLMF